MLTTYGFVLLTVVTALWLLLEQHTHPAQWMLKFALLGAQLAILLHLGLLEPLPMSVVIMLALVAMTKVVLLPARFSPLPTHKYTYVGATVATVLLATPLLSSSEPSNQYSLGNFIGANPRAYEGEPIHLSFPFRNGEYYIREGGTTRSTNYHYWSSFFRDAGMHESVRYAVDIYKVGTAGRDVNVAGSNRLEDHAMYGVPLYSPCDAVVFYLEDGYPDMPVGQRDMVNTRGNHIVLDKDGVKIAMLHLMPGTIAVEIGEEVKEGQFLGVIGNSGATGMPHLHIHASRGSTWFGTGVPMLFDGKFLIKGDKIIAPER